ncbi:copper transporter [Corynebacterium sp. 320]|uniref:Copper transporter n=1 Tax=Corynebacterium zhongnanshanii TaxID=2768834 RepID=A0ABQ6VH79_9CORY|nr:MULTISPECIES: copper transporter [Corynebacterium]KAB1503577.1 copper transporter [Corynebacterium sp. 320]KAB1553322.1 copper transporter [Corynebacterium sp. 321]KAB1553460.1 copper transporter [Corynebacterium sp. 319]KAB3523569.1 copper transporter [Corynebacterium zhongnanshanii]KAB3527713.1 copper transporter [Corynebacterium sp. 250]
MSKSSVIAGLGVGIALGTAFGFFALAPNVEGGPAGNSSAIQQELNAEKKRADVEELQSNAANDLLNQFNGDIVDGSLADTSVAVVLAPDAVDADVDALKKVLENAGATVNATIELTDKATSTDGADSLKSLASKSLPSGATLSEDKLSPGMHTGQLLGAALSDKTSESDRAVAIGALEKEGFLSHDGEVKDASLVVVVAGNADKDDQDGNYSNTFLSDLALGVDSSTDGAVLAARPSSAAKGGAVALVRGSREHVENVSTVDNINADSGRISVIHELEKQKDNQSKHVGVGENASALTA